MSETSGVRVAQAANTAQSRDQSGGRDIQRSLK